MRQAKNHFSGTVLKIQHQQNSVFELAENLKIVPGSERVVQNHEMPTPREPLNLCRY